MKKDTLRNSLLVTMSVLLIAVMVLFTGCGGTETLEDYVNSNEEVKTQIESYSGQDGMTVKVEENVLTYEYKYEDTYDESMIDEMKAQFEETMGSMSSTFESIGTTLEEESGIKDITVRVTYLNGDGSEIYSEDF